MKTCPYNHEMTPENTAIWGGKICCRICARQRQLEQTKRRKEANAILRDRANAAAGFDVDSPERVKDRERRLRRIAAASDWSGA